MLLLATLDAINTNKTEQLTEKTSETAELSDNSL